MKRSAWTAGAVLLVALVCALSYRASACTPTFVVVGGKKVQVTVADTEALLRKGLTGRAGLAPDEGMLFVFGSDGKPGFWMKGMRFSIDILWLDREGRIVHIVSRLSPRTYPKLYAPPVPSRYVLELPAGFAGRHRIRVGDFVQW